MGRRARVLVTNDDGIDSPGLAALARGIATAELDVVVAAPHTESSGSSAGLIAVEDEGHVVVQRRSLPGAADIPAYAVAAFPGFIVLAAAQDAFGPRPDVVLSGINRGGNIGRAVLHSGTVGAALTGGLHGALAMAVSLEVGLDPGAQPHWDSAVAVARTVLPLLLDTPSGTVLNVNVPNVCTAELRELRHAGLAAVGTVQSRVDEPSEGRLRITSTVIDHEPEPGSDAALLAAGHPTVTELHSVQAATEPALPGQLPSLAVR